MVNRMLVIISVRQMATLSLTCAQLVLRLLAPLLRQLSGVVCIQPTEEGVVQWYECLAAGLEAEIE